MYDNKKNPRTMIWKGGLGAKPDPFEYWINDLKSLYWSAHPVSPLLYDDYGNKGYTPDGAGWPIDFSYDYVVSCSVYNYQGKLVAVYQKQSDGGWQKISPNISLGQEANVVIGSPGATFRVDFVG